MLFKIFHGFQFQYTHVLTSHWNKCVTSFQPVTNRNQEYFGDNMLEELLTVQWLNKKLLFTDTYYESSTNSLLKVSLLAKPSLAYLAWIREWFLTAWLDPARTSAARNRGTSVHWKTDKLIGNNKSFCTQIISRGRGAKVAVNCVLVVPCWQIKSVDTLSFWHIQSVHRCTYCTLGFGFRQSERNFWWDDNHDIKNCVKGFMTLLISETAW